MTNLDPDPKYPKINSIKINLSLFPCFGHPPNTAMMAERGRASPLIHSASCASTYTRLDTVASTADQNPTTLVDCEIDMSVFICSRFGINYGMKEYPLIFINNYFLILFLLFYKNNSTL